MNAKGLKNEQNVESIFYISGGGDLNNLPSSISAFLQQPTNNFCLYFFPDGGTSEGNAAGAVTSSSPVSKRRVFSG